MLRPIPPMTTLFFVGAVLFTSASCTSEPPHPTTTLAAAVVAGNVEQVKANVYWCRKEGGCDIDALDQDGLTALGIAAAAGNAEISKVLIDGGANLGPTGRNAITPLHVAASQDKGNVVKILIDAGANVNAAAVSGFTPLHVAISADVAKMLIAAGANANANILNQDDIARSTQALLSAHPENALLIGATPLHLAAFNGNADVAKVLLDAGAKPNAISAQGTPLKIAVSNGKADVARALIAGGAEVNIQAENGITFLLLATQKSDVEMTKVLVAAGAKVNVSDDSGRTPLHYLTKTSEGAKLLLDAGANVNAPDRDGQTPLGAAASRGGADVVKLLVGTGAELNHVDRNSQTPLLSAISSREIAPEVAASNVKVLIDAGAKVDPAALHAAVARRNAGLTKILVAAGVNVDSPTPDGQGLTALHIAARDDSVEVARVLIDGGADVNTKVWIEEGDRNVTNVGTLGQTPLHFAADAGPNNSENGGTEVAKLLIDAGADVNVAREDGQTPLHIVAKNFHVGVAKLLLDAGANVNVVDKKGRKPCERAYGGTWSGSSSVCNLFPPDGASNPGGGRP